MPQGQHSGPLGVAVHLNDKTAKLEIALIVDQVSAILDPDEATTLGLALLTAKTTSETFNALSDTLQLAGGFDVMMLAMLFADVLAKTSQGAFDTLDELRSKIERNEDGL